MPEPFFNWGTWPPENPTPLTREGFTAAVRKLAASPQDPIQQARLIPAELARRVAQDAEVYAAVVASCGVAAAEMVYRIGRNLLTMNPHA